MDVVNVVVTCTKDKRFPVSKDCQLRDVAPNTLRERMQDWHGRLNRRWRERVSVKDLYAGDHWANVRSFESNFFKIDVWVCSAGFGLVRIDDQITPYAATFSGKHPDSVTNKLKDVPSLDASKHWWNRLTKWKGHFEQRPRSLSALMATYPKRSTLVVASNTYLKAIVGDLREGVDHLADPDQLSIVCAGTQKLDGLDANLVPCDARLQAATGGARRSLNTRLGKKILSESRLPPKASTLTRRYRELLKQQPAIATYDRRPMNDDDVKQFILKQLLSNPELCHSPLLRRLRDQNKACEQKRFAALYREVREQFDGE